MASIWTVAPDTSKIDLVFDDGAGSRVPFWIKVKRKLTVGEQRRVSTAGFRGVRARDPKDTEIGIDWQSQSFARAEVWLVDWSLEDDRQRKLALTREVIEQLHPEVFKLIEDAITEHVEAIDRGKKARAAAAEETSTSAPTSP